MLLLVVASLPAYSAQYAMVVGINDYQYGSDELRPGTVRNLKGAENDARRVASALRAIGVDLPATRVLLGSDATLDNFMLAWQQLLDSSLPGDSLIITFAGHGGQEKEVLAPIDEIDGYDETLMFWDFDPSKPYLGRLVDDELYAMFKSAGDRQILFVADSCHSGGLTRTMDAESGVSRQGGSWEFTDSLDDLADLADLAADEGEDWDSLDHVTYLTATDDEAVVVSELSIGGNAHGALSVSFAEGIEGKADTNGDGRVFRRELQDYVQTRVRTLADQRQTPGFAPRGGATAELSLVSISAVTEQPDQATETERLALPVPVQVAGMSLPAGVRGTSLSESASLRFRYENGEVISYYNSDELLRWSQSSDDASKETRARWQRLIDKYRFLQAMDLAYDSRQPALKLTTQCESSRAGGHCDGEHRLGESLTFEFDHLREGNGRFFVLFNLAGDGELQYQYPYLPGDSAELSSLPFKLALTVSVPVGRDDMVAMFCRKDPSLLKRLLKQNDRSNAPDPVQVVGEMRKADCQVNRMAVFTAI